MKLLMPPLLLLLAPYAIEAGHATPVKFEADSDSALSDSAPAPPPRRFIVGYKNRQGKYRAQSAAQKKSRTSSGPQSFSAQGAATTDGHDADLGQQNAVAVTLSSEASERLKEDPNIEYVEEDSIRYPTMMRGYHQHLKDDVLKENIPNNNNETRRDENYRKLTETVPYGIPMVQADQVPYDSTNPRTICIIDTGYNLGHEYLPSTNVVGIDGNLAWNEDGNGHGTHVAGIITAKANSVNGVVGVAPNIKLLIVRVFGDDGDWAYASNLIDAAYRCKDGGANVISMSLGGGGSSLFETNAYADLFTNHNILIVAAAGNDGNTQLSYPASYDSVVSVAAVDFNKDLASFSQRNNQVDIAAPGVDVLSTVPMGTGTTLGSLDVSGGSNIGIPMAGSPNGIASGTLVDCGIGKSDCTDAKGKICLIQRGSFSFARKVLACQNGGGLGAVIYNNGDGVVFSGTLGGTVTTIPSVGISNFDGLYLKANELEGNSATLAVGMSNYEYKSGTSMACPYVSAVAALIWSHDPTKTASQVRVALQSTAEDLGVAGRDNKYGYGLVQAAAACSTLTGSSCTPYDPFEWVTSAINESPSVQPTPFPTSAPTAGDTCSLHRDRCFKNVDCCSRKCKGKKGRRKCKGGKN